MTAITDPKKVAKISAAWDAIRNRRRDQGSRAECERGAKELYASQGLAFPKQVHWVETPEDGEKLAMELCHSNVPVRSKSGSFRPEYAASAERERKPYARAIAMIVHNCCWCWLLDGAVIFVDLPLFVKRDSAGRLHADSGPAVYCGPNSAKYSWHGVTMSKDDMEHPESITIERIRNERNAEVRRALMTMYGLDKYLEKTRAKIVQEDEFGTLLEIEWPQGTEKYVRVINGTPEADGTYSEFVLPVANPNCKTAHEAVAVSYRVPPEQYHPAFRT